MLTNTDYSALAETLTYPSKSLINGEWVAARSGATFETKNPANGKVLATLPACTSEDVDTAVASARAVFEAGDWSEMHPSERKAILCKLADLIETNLVELAVMEAIDAGTRATRWPVRRRSKTSRSWSARTSTAMFPG